MPHGKAPWANMEENMNGLKQTNNQPEGGVRHLPRYLRLNQIVTPNGVLPISASTWWQGVKDGRYPQPVRLGPRITAWAYEDIAAYLASAKEGISNG